ncbi:MAG: deoxyguanosinetriphosphate triphosphohydrolase [Janthinobacterium lividum]
MLAPYACIPENSRGRRYPENKIPYRSEFGRDRDRIIHSSAFRRLQYKTQVFINHEGDHYRNRLTHSLEVSVIARSLSKTLILSEDLAETIALAHDLGHTPFGHAGEEALNQCMKNYGGFSHNAHSLKIITKLEQKYAAYDGLNLSWEVLEGIVKHNGPLEIKIPKYILEYNSKYNLDINSYSSAEAQLASLSDDIAYICHDIEDGLSSGILSFADFSEMKTIDNYITSIKSTFPNITQSRLAYELVRKLTYYLVSDLLHQTNINIAKYKIKSANCVRNLYHQLVDFSDETKQEISKIKNFLFSKFYRHHQVISTTLKCQKIIDGLFSSYFNSTDLLPLEWQKLINSQDSKDSAEVIADYIAGMTDRFAIKEFQTIYNLNFKEI